MIGDGCAVMAIAMDLTHQPSSRPSVQPEPRDDREMVARKLAIPGKGDDFSRLGSDGASGENPVDPGAVWNGWFVVMEGCHRFSTTLLRAGPGIGKSIFAHENVIGIVRPRRGVEIAEEDHRQGSIEGG
jgi:hypothetical protein